jgi:serine/threonine-protein kinase
MAGDERKAGADAARLAALLGTRVGGCRLEAVLGRGAMGIVFRAVQESLGRPVALKILRVGPLNQEASDDRFFKEARAAARINHPNVVQVYDAGRDGETPFILMELVDGESLGRRLKREKKLAPAAVVELGIGAARGLDAAHRRGLVHRDVKPDNVLVAKDGTPKLVDFGLMKDLEDSGELTRDGHLLGTPNYMSPEACAGEALDERSDLYSLGVMLFYALTGELPFRSRTTHGILMKHISSPPPSVRDLEPRVPPALAAVVAKLLRKDRRERLPSAARLVEELLHARRAMEIEAGPATAPDAPEGGRLPPPLAEAELPLEAHAPEPSAPAAGGDLARISADHTQDESGAPEVDLLAPVPGGGLAEEAADAESTGLESAAIAAESGAPPAAPEEAPSAVETRDESGPEPSGPRGAVDTRDETTPGPPPPAGDSAGAREEDTAAASREAELRASDEPEGASLTPEDLFLRAKLHYLRQDWVRAERDLERAVGAAPANAALQFALACVLARQRQDERALEHLELAVAVGFRDRRKIEQSRDLQRLAGHDRYRAAIARIG